MDKRNVPIPGYIHPDNLNLDTGSYNRRNSKAYRTFTEGAKKKMGKDPYEGSVTAADTYVKISTEIEDNNCPECENVSIHTCPCAYNDKKCSQGHIWYTDRSGTVKMGNPHHK